MIRTDAVSGIGAFLGEMYADTPQTISARPQG
jgi:hypothetical protein